MSSARVGTTQEGDHRNRKWFHLGQAQYEVIVFAPSNYPFPIWVCLPGKLQVIVLWKNGIEDSLCSVYVSGCKMFSKFGKLRPYDCAVPGTSELNLTVSSPRENLPKYAFARPLKSYVLLYSMDLCGEKGPKRGHVIIKAKSYPTSREVSECSR